jgi:BirA family biotin operon repressor/biotin-[acetyl-CoA-carboxylase] ligase
MDMFKTSTDEINLPHKRLMMQGREIYFYRTVSSTNRVAQALAKQGAADGLIVMSSYQSAGIGRMQRPWICPPGRAITMSMILRAGGQRPIAPQFMLLCGAAVAETVRALSGADAGVKWPNDVLVAGKKICGILAQGYVPKDAPGFAVVGIGLNVRQTEDELPGDCRGTSTSLSLEAGRRLSRSEALHTFLRIWDKHYEAFIKHGYAYIREKWIENNITLGRKITLHEEPAQEGVAVDISENGGLLVQLQGGEIKELLSEEFTLGKAYYHKADAP